MITKAKYTEETLNWVSLELEDGTVAQTTVTDGIRRQPTDALQEFLSNGGVIEPQYTQIEIFSSLVVSKHAQVRNAYDVANELDIDYMSTTFQADKYSQNLVVSVLSAGSVTSGFFWVDKFNNQVAMTYAELQGLSGVILTRNQINFVEYQTLKSQTNAATTVAELDAILV